MNKNKNRLYIGKTLKNKKTYVDGGNFFSKKQKNGSKKIQKTNIWDHRKKSSPPLSYLEEKSKTFFDFPPSTFSYVF
jgi:hypothetical protein